MTLVLSFARMANDRTIQFRAAFAELRDPNEARQTSEAAVRELISEGLLTDEGQLTEKGQQTADAMVASVNFAADVERAVEEAAGKGLRF